MKYQPNILELTKPFYIKKGRIGVLLVHGFTSSPNDMRSLGEYLAERNLTVHGVRIQGHGVSHHILKKTNRYDWFYSVRRGADLLKKDTDKIFVIGFSMGGCLNLMLAEEDPSIRGMVLINTPIYTKQSRVIFWFIPLIKHFKKFSTKEWVKQMDNYFEKRDSGSYYRIPLDSAWQFYKLIQDTKNIMKDVLAPVYLIQSERDETINPDSVNYIEKNIGSEEKKKEIIDTHVHNILMNFPEKERIFENIYAFIKEKSENI